MNKPQMSWSQMNVVSNEVVSYEWSQMNWSQLSALRGAQCKTQARGSSQQWCYDVIMLSQFCYNF